METKRSKTVFIEYSSSEKGQHFMTVVQNVDHKRIIIGRIYRDYDKENKKSTYRATDFAGGPMFFDTQKDLYALKQKFIEHGHSLAMSVPQIQRPTEKPVYTPKAERANAIKNIREKKTSKEKTKEVLKTNPKSKTNNDQKEKEQDSKNPVKYKGAEQGKDENSQNANEKELETTESNSENTTPEEPEYIDMSREDELNQIREDNEDREQDMEIDI
jgi:hypothetical protein